MKVFTTYQNVFINNKVITYLIRVYEIEKGKYSPEVTTLTHDVILSTMIHKDLFNNQNYWDTVQDAEQAAKDALHLWVENIVNDDIRPYDELFSPGTVSNTKYLVKEDMEEKKVKPFDLEAAKAGKPVCTRDGRKVRIICFDAKQSLPIVALVTTAENNETIISYNSNGMFAMNETCCDLMMLPERREGWVNLYKSSSHPTKEEAMKYRNKCNDYIDTIKVSWEE